MSYAALAIASCAEELRGREVSIRSIFLERIERPCVGARHPRVEFRDVECAAAPDA